ncbi:substrate-binding domain-containing protein [Dyella nitratireducens]|uniref:PBP domain-containing protein n=1 Tax=Dyella nitratireducens TaxID=1849580 RepID=A0ABQ1FWY2_9GAMM|nr:substrate-binding domain-containing protein [Dyella nitratireducens]GGA31977.1 hypothetical protein GCM10010981_21390 [Dyella nitratireducens]
MNRFSTRTKLIAGALALVLAGVSHASGTQVGGGATLPSIGYVGANAASNLQVFGSVTGTGVDPNSLFGVYAQQTGNPGVSYCLTGSGAGKDILAAPITLTVNGVSTSFSVQNACTKNSVGTVSGFGADATISGVSVGRSDLTQPNFAGADAPLAASDYANYQTGHGSAAFPTQFPAVAGAVAIAFNVLDTNGVQVTSSATGLSDSMICKIFAGVVTNWNDPTIASAFTVSSGAAMPNAAINVQYRSDGSGTSFGFSNHLSAVCPSFVNSSGQTAFFQASQSFTNVVTGFPSASPVVPGVLVSIPSNWTGSSGNASVANAVKNTASSLGYVETANALAIAPNLKFANVNSASPITNFGTTLNLLSSEVVYNEVISGTNNSNGTPALEAISSISGVTPPPTGSTCIALVNPSVYAKTAKGGFLPLGTYPIVAISYLLSHAQGVEASDLTNTQNLVNAPYNTTITGSVTTIGSGTGLAFLNPAPSTGGGAFSVTAAGACVNSGN